ncbi:MAG TPA: restriction endonuclease subunit S [Piscirickettsiaceae bacterium]|nr:restriction endonuclease subunit S [Piscirickettsiaceae bacterium]|tara:strand:- start:9935 stop:11239 length:1305 start_codon:yes stop_codon:yes gene_type:complete
MLKMSELPKYDAYKDSGHEWIGGVPQEWEVSKLGGCLSAVSIKGYPKLPLLSITREQGVIQRDVDDQDSNHNFIPDDLSGYKLLKEGQFGMNKMKAWQGSYGVSKFTGIVSPAYFIFDFTKPIWPSFFNWAIRSSLYVSYFGSASDGVRVGQWDLSKDRMKVIPFLLPPEDEQRLIAKFLDKKNTQIDEAIAIKEQQIALLKERKQIIIQKAVTQGLDPNVPMKDSGVDWIGEIPANWEVKQSRYLFRVVRRTDRRGDEVKYSVTQARGLVPTHEMVENSTQAASFDSFQLCHEGDLVLNKYKAHLGVFWKASERGIITNNYTVLSPLDKVSSKYFELLFHTPIYVSTFRTLVYGVTEGMSPLYTSDFYNIRSIVPPLEEQKAIERHVMSAEEIHGEAVRHLEDQKASLAEYKISLINSAVTGKIRITPDMVEA